MALPREYIAEDCPIARTLEIIGERWTLLILRDAFYGVSRFSDFREHLGIPRAVLTERLNLLVEHGILARVTAASGREEYSLTAKGEGLWPTIWSLICWGNDYYTAEGRQRQYTHADCGGEVPADGVCAGCGIRPGPGDLTVHPRPWAKPKTDPVSVALSVPHRLLTPITRTSAPAQRAETPAQRAETPAQRAETPAQRAETPAQRAETPAQRAETPAQRAETPAQRAETPAQRAETPAQRAETPAQRAETPAQRAETPASA